jgi:hypothetical protein
MGLKRSGVLVTKTDIHFWKTATQTCCTWRKLLQKTFWQQEANLWHEVASNDLQSPFKVGGWAIFFSPVPRQT